MLLLRGNTSYHSNVMWTHPVRTLKCLKMQVKSTLIYWAKSGNWRDKYLWQIWVKPQFDSSISPITSETVRVPLLPVRNHVYQRAWGAQWLEGLPSHCEASCLQCWLCRRYRCPSLPPATLQVFVRMREEQNLAFR